MGEAASGQLVWSRTKVLWSAYVGINLALILSLRPDPEHPDWQLWLSLPDKIATGTLYAQTGETVYVWSPVIAPIMALAPFIGYWVWAALHVAVVFLLRDWRLIGFMLVSWGFWIDVIGGNTFGFVLVAGALALAGSRPAALVYLVLCIVMPRPIQLPLAVYLLWTMPGLWRTAGVALALHSLAVVATGYFDEWIGAMLAQHGPPSGNLGPTAFLGRAWLIVGIPLAAWLTWRGRVGWAGLAVSPYILPAYLVTPVWELTDHSGPDRVLVARGVHRVEAGVG